MGVVGALLKNRRAGETKLAWSAPPEGTAELLLVVEDADAPMPRPFVHCVALIEPQVRELPSGSLAAVEQAKPRALLSWVSGPVLARGRLTGVYER